MTNIKVIIHQLGDVEDITAGSLAAGLRGIFDIEIMAGPKVAVPAQAYDAQRGQFNSRLILAALAGQKMELAAAAGSVLLGLTAVDLFVPRLNFVFGEADQESGVAVISSHRLRPKFYGEEPDAALVHERLLKEAIHELGHVFGLDHCPVPSCIMHFSNTVQDTDRKGPGFCARDRARLAAAGVRLVSSGS